MASAAKVTLGVELEISNAEKQVEELRKKMKNVSLSSDFGRALSAQIDKLEGQINDLRKASQKEFGSKSEINSFINGLEGIGKTAEKIQTSFSRVKFSDFINWDEDTLKIKNQMEALIRDLGSQKTNLKKTMINEIAGTDSNKDLFKNLGINLNNTASGIEQQFKNKLDNIKNIYENYQRELATYNNTMDMRKQYKDVVSLNGKDTIKNLVTNIGQGVVTDKSGILTPEQLATMKDNMISQLKLTPEDVEKLFENVRVNNGGELTSGKIQLATEQKLNEISAARKAKISEPKLTGLPEGYDVSNIEAGIAQLQNVYDQLSSIASGKNFDFQIRFGDLSKQVEEAAAALRQLLSDAVNGRLSLENWDGTLKSLGINLNSMAGSANKAGGELKALTDRGQEFDRLAYSIKRAFSAYAIVSKFTSKIKEAYNHIKQLDKTMNEIAIVSDQSMSDLWGQVSEYSAVAQQFGVAIQGAYQVSAIYYQAGYDSTEIMSLTTETLKLAKVAGLDYATTTNYMMTALRGFNIELEKANEVVDTYAALSANTAVNSQELAVAISKTASSAANVGSTFKETSAMMATMIATTRESATNINNNLTLFIEYK